MINQLIHEFVINKYPYTNLKDKTITHNALNSNKIWVDMFDLKEKCD